MQRYNWIGLGLLVGVDYLFFANYAKDSLFISGLFGTFSGVMLSIIIRKVMDDYRDATSCKSLLQNCLTQTNSNRTVIENDVLKHGCERSPTLTHDDLNVKYVRLKSTLQKESYSAFKNSGLQTRLPNDIVHCLLFVDAKVNDLVGYVDSRLMNSVNSYNSGRLTIENEWKSLYSWSMGCKSELEKLRVLIKREIDPHDKGGVE